jgi:4-diphosphocytidyl-2-C-methyl-D-erythritol kinase
MIEHAGQERVEQAYAKINLVLRILAREASGYHSIETLFQRLALHDDVTVRIGNMTRALSCDGPEMPAGGLGLAEDNLAWRAAEAYVREANWDTGWSIDIHKRIPVGGGLGGGSADAAAVLRAMESMSPTPLGPERLLEIGGSLGADVPFLVSGASRAWAWGRGDRLLVLPPLPAVPVLLFPFADGVNTAVAYQAFAAMREATGERVAAAAFDLEALSSWESIAAIAANDFERVVLDMHAGVAALLPTLQQMVALVDARRRGLIGMLSGSGATCFLLIAMTGLNLGFPGIDRSIRTETN